MNKAIIIGCGITGAFAALEMAKSSIQTILIETAPEPSFGTTNANSGIIHSSQNTKTNTLKFSLVDEGNAEIKKLSKLLNFGYNQCGEIIVIPDESQMPQLLEMEKLAKSQNLTIKLLNSAQITELEPNVTGYAGLLVEDAAIINPQEFCQSVWNTASNNGIAGKFAEKVVKIDKIDEIWRVTTDRNSYDAQFVINCAGLYAGEISELALKTRNKVVIRAKKGEEYILNRTQKNLVKRVIFPLANDTSKGTLVIPTFDGTTMVGPTSERCDEYESHPTTAEGKLRIFEAARKLVPGLDESQIITSFTGFRAADQSDDFIVDCVDNFINLAGIQSPGLTAAPLLGKMGADFITKDRFKEIIWAPIHTKFAKAERSEQEKMVQEDANHCVIIDECECVSLADVHNAITDGARTVDGVKTRTRAGMGDDQGSCNDLIVKVLSQRLGISMSEVLKKDCGSEVAVCGKGPWSGTGKGPWSVSQSEIVEYKPQKLDRSQILLKSEQKDEVLAQITGNYQFDVVVIGAGQAGMSAAKHERKSGKSVLVVERSCKSGGNLIQSVGDGYTGPGYAQKLEADCLGSKVSVLLCSFVMKCVNSDQNYVLETVVKGLGIIKLAAKRVISCIGQRDRTRADLNIAGTRPAGVYTARLAQKMINLHNLLPGKKVVVYGSSDVGMDLAEACWLAGASVTIIEKNTKCQSQKKLDVYKIPVIFSKQVINVIGDRRVTAIEYVHVDPRTNATDKTNVQRIDCDCLLLAAGVVEKKYGPLEREIFQHTFFSTVQIKNSDIERLPVKVSLQVEQSQLKAVALKIRNIVVEAPICIGDVIAQNILEGSVISTCSAELK